MLQHGIRGSGQAGAVAQLGERSVRNAEVRGSIPLGSIPGWPAKCAMREAVGMVATIAQLVEHVTRNDGVVGSNPTGGLLLASRGGERTNWDRMPRGVTGNTSDSGSEESWFDPRRGNSEGWPSGLRRRPAKALTREGLVGSNPTPSAGERGSPRRGWASNPGWRLRRLRLVTSPSGRLAPDLGCESHPV